MKKIMSCTFEKKNNKGSPVHRYWDRTVDRILQFESMSLTGSGTQGEPTGCFWMEAMKIDVSEKQGSQKLL
jgi:hypothetical protein